jgi:hypothetical protein
MKDEFTLENINIKLLIYFATPYAFLCAILYLYSFWSRFHINFLEFITLADLLIVSLYPLTGTFIGLLTGVFIGRVLPGKKEVSPKQAKRRVVIANLGFIILSVQGALKFGWHNLYLFTPFLISFWFSYPLEKFLISKNMKVTGLFSWIIILVPLLSYGVGANTSHKILRNESVRYAEISQFQNNELFKNQSKIKYIGLGGRHYFFISEDNSNFYIINSEKFSIIELSKPSSENHIATPWEKIKRWFNKDSKSKPEDLK